MDDLSICSAGSDDNSDDDSDHDEGDDEDEDEDEEEDEQIKDSDYESSDQEEGEGDSEEDRRCGDRAVGAGEEPVQRKSHNTGRAGGDQEAKDDHLVATSVASATAALANCSLEDGGEPLLSNHKNANNNRSIDGSSSKLQKVNKLSQYVPYSAQLESTRIQLWTNLKAHHCEASVAQGVQLERWIYACNQ